MFPVKRLEAHFSPCINFDFEIGMLKRYLCGSFRGVDLGLIDTSDFTEAQLLVSVTTLTNL
jgi:hypothetical protein